MRGDRSAAAADAQPWRGVIIALLLAALSACAVPLADARLDNAMFQPPAPVAAPLPGRIGLVMAPALRDRFYPAETQMQKDKPLVRLPIGRIVQAALAQALAAAFEGGVEVLDAAPANTGAFSAVLWVGDVGAEYDTRLLWLLPLPLPLLGVLPIGERELSLRLAFDLRGVDARGQPLLERHYLSDWQRQRVSMLNSDPKFTGVVSMAHQAAWQQAQAAVREFSDGLKAERLKPRHL